MALSELKGLEGLSKGDREAFINGVKAEGIVDDSWTDNEIDRIYRNGRFVERYGLDTFRSMPNYEDRDRFLLNDILREEKENRFSTDPNLNLINVMSLERQRELFESGYLSPEEINKIGGNGTLLVDVDPSSPDWKQQVEETLSNRNPEVEEAQRNAFSDVSTSTYLKDILGNAAGGLALGYKGGPISAAIGAGIGALWGLVEANLDTSDTSYVQKSVVENNLEKLQEIRKKDVQDKRESEEVKETASNNFLELQQGLADGYYDSIAIDKMLDNIAGNHGTDENPMYGSVHYNAFKDSYLKDLDLDTKMKIIADFSALSEVSPDAAFEGLDQIFQNIVASRQSGFETVANVLKQNAIGLTNDVMQLQTMPTAAVLNFLEWANAIDEGSAKRYLEEGKIGDFDMGIFGPDYWYKASKYNLWTPEAIAEAEKYGGLSDATTVWNTNTNNYNIGRFAAEGFGQMHYLAYYALAGKVFGKISEPNPGKLMTTVATVVPNLSMGSQMGYDAYMNTQETLTERYNEMVRATMEELMQPMIDSIDWDAEVQKEKNRLSNLPTVEGTHRIIPSDEFLKERLIQAKKEELVPLVEQQAIDANADVLKEINSQSMDAFRMESIMDLMKNSISATTFRNWMYNNNAALQSRIRLREQGVRIRGNTATHSNPKPKFWRTAGKEMLGEGIDEYLDGVTTGMAEGYNVAQFEGWLANRENPGTYDTADITFSALGGMAMGIKNALNENNLYEAALGAVSPWMPLFSRGSAKVDPNNPDNKGWRPFFTNAIYEEYVNDYNRYVAADERIKGINKFLTDNEDRLRNIARLDAPNLLAEWARGQGDTKMLKDAELQQLIQAAILINTATETAEEAEMVRSMQETLSRLANDEYTDQEKQQLGAEFAAQPGNSGITAEEGYQRLVHNAKRLLETSQKLKEVEAEIDKQTKGKDLSSNARAHLISLAMQQEDWKTRLGQITKELGIGDSGSSSLTVEDMATRDDAEALISEINDHRSSVGKYLSKIDGTISSIEAEMKRVSADSRLSVREKQSRLNTLNNRLESLRQGKTQVQKEYDRLETLHHQAQTQYLNWNEDKELVTADSIMNMSAAKIQYMIENRDKYTVEQAAEIDKVIDRLNAVDPNYLDKLEDARKIALSIEEGSRARTAIIEGPRGYDGLVKRLRQASTQAQIARENHRYENQVFLSWESMTPEQILRDAVDNGRTELVDRYRELNNGKRKDELTGISELIKLQEELIDLINIPDRVVADNLRQSVVNMTSIAKNRDEAINILNDAINDSSISKDIRDQIKDLLDSADLTSQAASVTYQQEQAALSRREWERQERQRAAEEEAARMAAFEEQADREAGEAALEAVASQGTSDYDAARNEAYSERADQEKQQGDSSTSDNTDNEEEDSQDSNIETPTPNPDGSNITETMPTGREPVSMVDEEEVNLNDDISELPNTEESLERELEEAERDGTVEDSAAKGLQETITTGNAEEGEYVGNAHSRYRVVDGVVHLVEDTQTNEKWLKKNKPIFEWFEAANIHFQEVIDNELLAISQLDPDVKILKVAPKYNATNDIAMRDVYMLVVEYTDEVADIHRSDDSIIEADGKKWLVIGSLGYNSKDDVQESKFRELTKNHNPLDRRFRDYFREHPNERFHVDNVASTKISRINPGRLVRETLDGSKETHPLSEILDGVRLEDVRWAIAKGGELKTVGSVDGQILQESGLAQNTGAVYVLIPAAGGQYIAAYMQPAYTDTLKEGSELRTIINDALTKLVSSDYNKRQEALKKLSSYIYIDGVNYNIHIGNRNDSTLTIIQDGVKKTFNLSDPGVSPVSVMQELLKSHFKINIGLSTLTNPDLLELYNEAGVFTINLQKFGVMGADFTVYEMDKNGVAEIPDAPIIVMGATPASRERTTGKTLRYNSKLYTKTDTGWRDFEGNKITDETTIRHLNYLDEIRKGKAPSSSTATHEQYVFSSDKDNPIVISVSNSQNTVTELSKEDALRYLEEYEDRLRQEERERAIDEAMRETHEDQEEVDLTSDIKRTDDAATKGFDEWFYGDQEEEVEETEEEEEVIPPLPPAPATPDPNQHDNLSDFERSEGSVTVNDIMISHMNQFLEIVMEKISKGLWTDVPMDSNTELMEYLREKGVQTENIPDVEAWLDDLKNCK